MPHVSVANQASSSTNSPPRMTGRAGLRRWQAARRAARRSNPAPICAPPLADATEELLQMSAGPLRVRTLGDGPPVLFVHGLLVDGSVWNATAEPLARDFRCVIPDLPLGSHRHPMRADADLTGDGLAALLDELLERLDLTDVTVVANDSGGAITQLWMAGGAPRVGRVVLATVDAFENFPPPGFAIYPRIAASPTALRAAMNLMRSRFLRHQPITYGLLTHRRVDDALVRSWVRPAIEQAGIRRDLRAFLRGVHRTTLLDAEDRIAAFDRPVLLAWAPEQRWFPVEHADRLAALLTNARVAEIHGSGAFPQLDQPEQLAREVAAFASAT